MSFLAKLVIGSSEYNILNVSYDITQPWDHTTQQPTAAPKGGIIQIKIEAGNNNELMEWIISHTMVKNGKIIFYRRDANSPMKTVNFNDAFCVYLKEVFISDGPHPMVTELTLSCRELKINNNAINNKWPGMKSEASSSSSSDSSSKSEQIMSFQAGH